jgi:hypothetical protein
MKLRMSAVAIAVLLGSMSGAESPPACKPVKRYGVSGCELLLDRTCPQGYHKQVVDPPDPRMKAPSYIMCVPDKPQPKEQPPNPAPKSNR